MRHLPIAAISEGELLICFYDLPHLFPLPKERTYQSEISG